MLALVISETSSLVHCIFFVASLATQVSASRSPSISEGYDFEEIVANGFSEGKMKRNLSSTKKKVFHQNPNIRPCDCIPKQLFRDLAMTCSLYYLM